MKPSHAIRTPQNCLCIAHDVPCYARTGSNKMLTAQRQIGDIAKNVHLGSWVGGGQKVQQSVGWGSRKRVGGPNKQWGWGSKTRGSPVLLPTSISPTRAPPRVRLSSDELLARQSARMFLRAFGRPFEMDFGPAWRTFDHGAGGGGGGKGRGSPNMTLIKALFRAYLGSLPPLRLPPPSPQAP